MTGFRLSGVAAVLCLGVLFISLLFSGQQDASATLNTRNSHESESHAPISINLSVEEVRLDVVVLDKKSGNPVTDLTADDFEVFQDNKRQQIQSCVYIDNSQPITDAQSHSALKAELNHPSSFATSLKRDDVRRTILFVVDDYAMTLENGYHTKIALGNFVEKQMQPGDMVAIFRTAYGNNVLNMFQFEKREVLARINSIAPTIAPRPFDPVTGSGVHEGMWQYFMMASHENRKAAISQGIRALGDMPGRKILFLVTPLSVHDDPSALVSDNRTEVIGYDDPGFKTTSIRSTSHINDRIRRYEELYHELADDALRASVVVNILDVDGLNNFGSNYADAEQSFNTFGSTSSPTGDVIAMILQAPRFEPIRPTNPLPAQTGGIIIQDNNFFHDGIGKQAESLMKGYYLVSYEPPPNTFATRGKKEAFRRLRVSVKRKGTVIHTRNGFFGRQDDSMDVETPQRDSLAAAILSPFQHAGLEVNMLSGYDRSVQSGYHIRSWIHVDPKDVKIVETPDGDARIYLETVCLTSDMNGYVHDIKQVTHTYAIGHEHRDENIAWIRQHGIRFAMLLPVKKSGFYYVRSAVKDIESGNVGSAYQFIEIPDLDKKELELSDLFMVNGAEDLKWLLSDEAEGGEEGLFFPVFQAKEMRSPALRTYSRGDQLHALAMLYNAGDKAASGSGIETQCILYRDGKEFRRFTPGRVKPSDAENAFAVPILQRFTLGEDIPPGDYVLQLTTIDPKNSKKQKGGVRGLSFRVVDK